MPSFLYAWESVSKSRMRLYWSAQGGVSETLIN